MGHYIDTNTLVNGVLANADIVRTAFNALDQVLWESLTGVMPMTPTITGGSINGIVDLAIADGGTGASDAAGARTALGLGSIATQDASAVDINGGTVDGAVIGGTTPAAGTFTEFQVRHSTTPLVTFARAGVARATLYFDGDYLAFGVYDAAGAFLTNPLYHQSSTDILVMNAAISRIAGSLDHDGSTLGFYGTTPASKPTVTGSRGGNAALASLCTQLAALGLITNSTS